MWIRIETDSEVVNTEVGYRTLRELQMSLIVCNREKGLAHFVLISRTPMGKYGVTEWSADGRRLLRRVTII